MDATAYLDYKPTRQTFGLPKMYRDVRILSERDHL